MLKRGADINAKNEHGYTPLHNACLRAGEGTVLFLLQNNAAVDTVSKYAFLHHIVLSPFTILMHIIYQLSRDSTPFCL